MFELRNAAKLVITAALLAAAAPVQANNLLASDLIYLPVVAHNEGVAGSIWRSDVVITNVDSTPVDVAIFYMPSGVTSNAGQIDSITDALGGREELGFTFVDARLADIQPGASVIMEDILADTWYAPPATQGDLGGMVIFAWEAGTLTDPLDPGARTLRNVVVTARVYNQTTLLLPVEEENPDGGERGDTEPEPETGVRSPATFGQSIIGVPWYMLVDGGAIDEEEGIDFTEVIFPGLNPTGPYRFNIGFFNCSDVQTTITILAKTFLADGTPLLDDNDSPIERILTLAPLGHFQLNGALSTWFQLDETTEVDNLTIKLEVLGWSSESASPIPAFAAYGSLVDNRSNDPTTFLPSFIPAGDRILSFPENPIEDPVKAQRQRRRMLELPGLY